MNRQNLGFHKTWRRLIQDTQLSHGAFRLWHYLHSHSDGEGRCWPGHRTIARDIGCRVESITPWATELVGQQWLDVQNDGEGTRNYYTLLNGFGEPFKSGKKRVGKQSHHRNGKQIQTDTENSNEPLRIPVLKREIEENGSNLADSPTSTSSCSSASQAGRSESESAFKKLGGLPAGSEQRKVAAAIWRGSKFAGKPMTAESENYAQALYDSIIEAGENPSRDDVERRLKARLEPLDPEFM